LTGANNDPSDPLFIATARGPYRIDDTSPGYDKCNLAVTIDQDFVARGQDQGDEAGAFEWTP